MTFAVFLLILLAVCLNVAAQISLKLAMQRIGHFEFAINNIGHVTSQLLTSPWLLTGITIYILSMVFWLLILSRTEVSMAYPLISLGYVINAIAAYYVFGEHIGLMRMLGIFIILIGVYFVAKS